METEIKLPETVFVVDASFLEFATLNLKSFFEQHLGRTLDEIDLSLLFTYLMLDTEISIDDKQVQVLLAYDGETENFSVCSPSSLKEELNGVAFKNEELGEFLFASTTTEGMVSREELFLDLVRVSCENDNVKNIVLLTREDEYSQELRNLIEENKNKNISQFGITKQPLSTTITYFLFAYPAMKAMGIRGDEL